MHIIFLNEAYSDIDSIFEYISRDSIRYANETVNKIYYKTDLLKEFPYIGRYVPELSNKRYRELLYKNYRIVYSVLKDIIHIHSIIHNKRNFKLNFNSNINNLL